eukprot:GHVS01064734.1.p1 GENE.GHVS01064734.1~~GHVS01064734.1.p1  ORF type:complete len:224 (+),score=13.28 GHVS01064734.1:82-753(+)
MRWLESILAWENNITSACTLGCINLFYALVFLLDKTLLSLTCYLLLFFLGVGLFFRLCAPAGEKHNRVEVSGADTSPARNVDYVATKGHSICSLFSPNLFCGLGDPSMEIISYKCMEDNMLYIYDTVNRIGSVVRYILLWKDPVVSTKFVGLMWMCGYLASWLSFGQLSFLCVWIITCGSMVKDLVITQYLKPLLCPHVTVIKGKIVQFVEAIPRMKTAKKGS